MLRRVALRRTPRIAPHEADNGPLGVDVARHTRLHKFIKHHGGEMTNYAGWSMPGHFKPGLYAEHCHTRTKASLFDVSHMCQIKFHGADRERFVEWVTVADVHALENTGHGRLAVMLNPSGGVVDDLIVTRYEKDMFAVVNAGRATVDLEHLRRMMHDFHGDVHMEILQGQCLLALQGPEAEHALAPHVSGDLNALQFMYGTRGMTVCGRKAQIMRCGYTGEDGFEISVAPEDVEHVAATLLGEEAVELAGLGARNSLRVESGLCLYGHELTERITPVESSLMWTITKRRREEGGFIGYEGVMQVRATPTLFPARRVGIKSRGPCARDGTEIVVDDTVVGHVTSGCPSPSLGCNVAQAYVPREFAHFGTKLKLRVRNRTIDGEVVKLPFVKANYRTQATPVATPTTPKPEP